MDREYKKGSQRRVDILGGAEKIAFAQFRCQQQGEKNEDTTVISS